MYSYAASLRLHARKSCLRIGTWSSSAASFLSFTFTRETFHVLHVTADDNCSGRSVRAHHLHFSLSGSNWGMHFSKSVISKHCADYRHIQPFSEWECFLIDNTARTTKQSCNTRMISNLPRVNCSRNKTNTQTNTTKQQNQRKYSVREESC